MGCWSFPRRGPAGVSCLKGAMSMKQTNSTVYWLDINSIEHQNTDQWCLEIVVWRSCRFPYDSHDAPDGVISSIEYNIVSAAYPNLIIALEMLGESQRLYQAPMGIEKSTTVVARMRTASNQIRRVKDILASVPIQEDGAFSRRRKCCFGMKRMLGMEVRTDVSRDRDCQGWRETIKAMTSHNQKLSTTGLSHANPQSTQPRLVEYQASLPVQSRLYVLDARPCCLFLFWNGRFYEPISMFSNIGMSDELSVGLRARLLIHIT